MLKPYKSCLFIFIMARQDEVTKERVKKIEELKKQGVNPYPYSFKRTHKAAQLQEKYASLQSEKFLKDSVIVAGRLLNFRDIGRISFGVLQDSTGKIQLVLQEPETKSKVVNFFKKFIDAGDFIGVQGTIFRTKRGELSILVKNVEILSKAILSLPDKWHGLEDKEERYRKRYLDFIMNPSVKDVFLKRSKIIELVRQFLNKRDFIEVETPILQPIYGGTNARPFETHLNALNMRLYLRVAPELYLKRLVVGGFEKVYEIGRNFRNEGIDSTHNPEFTMVEWYEAYADYNIMMDTAEELYKYISRELSGSLVLEFRGRKVDLQGSWPRIPMTQSIRENLGLDAENLSEHELLDFAKKRKVDVPTGASKGIIINTLFEKLVAEKLDGPIWIIDYPREVSPLAKPHRTKPEFVERFECYIAGKEIGDGWSEIIDPSDQRSRFEKEQLAMRAGKSEAHPMDEEFITALEYGMPVLGGIGIGIDRLVMFFTNSESIRDVLLFPFMKPRENNELPLNEKRQKKEGNNGRFNNKK